jgi:hypothetical protein
LLHKGRKIQRRVVYARYPLKVADGWVTPMEYYILEKDKTIIDDAKSVRSPLHTESEIPCDIVSKLKRKTPVGGNYCHYSAATIF